MAIPRQLDVTTATGTSTLRLMRCGRSWCSQRDSVVGNVETITSSAAVASTTVEIVAGVSHPSQSSPVAVAPSDVSHSRPNCRRSFASRRSSRTSSTAVADTLAAPSPAGTAGVAGLAIGTTRWNAQSPSLMRSRTAADSASPPTVLFATITTVRISTPTTEHTAGARDYAAAMLLTTLDLTTEEFELGTGWAAKPEGLCKGDVCVPAPDAVVDGRIDVAAAADRLGMALVRDDAGEVWALGPESGGRALTTAIAPDLVLPDEDGNPFKLSALHGRKVLLVAWASW